MYHCRCPRPNTGPGAPRILTGLWRLTGFPVSPTMGQANTGRDNLKPGGPGSWGEPEVLPSRNTSPTNGSASIHLRAGATSWQRCPIPEASTTSAGKDLVICPVVAQGDKGTFSGAELFIQKSQWTNDPQQAVREGDAGRGPMCTVALDSRLIPPRVLSCHSVPSVGQKQGRDRRDKRAVTWLRQQALPPACGG